MGIPKIVIFASVLIAVCCGRTATTATEINGVWCHIVLDNNNQSVCAAENHTSNNINARFKVIPGINSPYGHSSAVLVPYQFTPVMSWINPTKPPQCIMIAPFNLTCD